MNDPWALLYASRTELARVEFALARALVGIRGQLADLDKAIAEHEKTEHEKTETDSNNRR